MGEGKERTRRWQDSADFETSCVLPRQLDLFDCSQDEPELHLQRKSSD